MLQWADIMEDAKTPKIGRGPRKGAQRQHTRLPYDPSHPYANSFKRVPDAYDPALLDRQTRAYEERVAGKTLKQIATALGCSLPTVTLDIKMESQRRIAARPHDRATTLNMQIDRYEKLKVQGLERIAKYERDADANVLINPVFCASLRNTIASEAKNLAAIEKAIGSLLGLDEPIKVEVNLAQGAAMQTMMDVFNCMSPEQVAHLRQRAVHAQQARVNQNVTPPTALT